MPAVAPAGAAPVRRRAAARNETAAGPRDGGDLQAGATPDRDDPFIHRMPGHYIRRLQQVAVALFMREVSGTDITPVQFAALAALRHQRSCDQATLGALIGYDRATVGGVVDRLEAKRWVVRTSEARDRRMRHVALTPAGSATLRRMTGAVERAQSELFAPLRVDERRQFARLCRKLLAAHLG